MEYKWVALSVTSVGMIMASIDTRIVVVGLPTVGHQLGIGIGELIWVTQAYILTSTVFALLVGRLGDQIGRVKLYKIGFMIFTIGSALAAISLSGFQLIASRAVQGIGYAMIAGNTSAMITDAAKGKDLGTLLSLNMVIGNLGSIAGLTLSGVILSIADWRALFYINVPIGIFGTYWAHKRLIEISTRDPQRGVDWPGFIAFSFGLSSLLLGLTFLSFGSNDSAVGTSMLLAGLSLIIVFTWLQTKTPSPLLDLRLFKIRPFAVGNLSFMLQSFTWFGMTIFLSLYLQLGLGLSPLAAGLTFLPMQFSTVTGSYISGKLTDKFGKWSLVSTMGNNLVVIALFLLLLDLGRADLTRLSVALAMFGFGNGLFITPNRSMVMSSVPPEKRGASAGFGVTTSNTMNVLSYGCVMLLLTLVIPYSELSSLLQAETGLAMESVRAQFIQASSFVIYAFLACNIVTIIPTLLSNPKTDS